MHSRKFISGCTLGLIALAAAAYFALPQPPKAQGSALLQSARGTKFTVDRPKSKRLDCVLSNVGTDNVKITARYVSRDGVSHDDQISIIDAGGTDTQQHELKLAPEQSGRFILKFENNVAYPGYVELRTNPPGHIIGHALSTIQGTDLNDNLDWHFILNQGMPF